MGPVKRAQLAALWVATIVATWFVVRGQVDDGAQPATEQPVAAAPSRSVRVSALSRPSITPVHEAVDDKPFQNALATLERDMADGRWSLADRDRLIAGARQVSGKQVVALYTVLFPKLNDGSVKSDIDGPPF